MNPRIATAIVGAALVVIALSACSNELSKDEPAPPPTTAPKPTEHVSEPPPPASAKPTAELTCESMITSGAVASFTEIGWIAEPKEFAIGSVALADGLLCFWADYSIASDHGQLYGWSPIDADQAVAAQGTLLSAGWTREDAAEGTYYTEDPQFSMGTDEDGYGMTYLFGDGWVKLADTKQGLILIEWAG